MANYNDVIEKNKRYLTQAQIDALVAASKQYNVENAGNRAGALSSARQQFDAGYRGLQNMGLAGATAAQPTSGEVPRLIQQIRTPVDDYNRRLQDVENKRLNALGGQFAQQTQTAWAAQAQREAEARARQETLQQQYQRAQTVARVVNNKDIPSAPKLDPRTLVVESVKEFDAPTAAERAAQKYQQDGLKRTAAVAQQAAINAAAALLGITVPNNMQQAEQVRLDREAATARKVQNTVTQATKPVLNQKTGGQYTYDTYTEAKEMQRAADDIAAKAARAARANKTNDTTEQDERALKEAQANVDYIDSLYQKMAKGEDLTDKEIQAMSQDRVAVQQRDLAKEKLENPEKYAARLVLSDPSKRGTSAWTKATQLMAPEIADNVLESMGISKPTMTDEQFTADIQMVKDVRRSLDVIDSLRQEQENKRKTGTTGSIDYDQQFIDEELETLKKLGYTEDQARKLVKRVSNERQARSEYEYYHKALETEYKNDGLVPSKPVNQSETDTTYRYANNLPVISLPEYAPLAGPAEYMNKDQRNTYNALYETEGLEAANKYVEDITPILNLQRANDDQLYRQEMVNKNAGSAIWQNILSVGTNLIGNVPAMLEKLAITGYNIVANPDVPVYIDQNSGLSQLSNRTNYIREATSEKILDAHPNTWGKVANFLYQSGMSMADSAAAMAVAGVLGNTHAVDALFFSSAGNEAYRDARERGATQEQAMGFSILSGAAEAIFEHVSVETFADQFIRQNAKARRSTIAKLLIQSGTEASEEVTTEIADKLADAWVMGDKSDFNKKVSELMRGGNMSKEEATKQAFMDAIKDVGMAGLGGLVSGLGFGLTGAIATKKSETKTGKAVKENGKLDRLTRAAKLFGGDVAQQAAEVEAGKQSDAQVGSLLHELQLAQNEALGIDAESNEQITEAQAEEIAKKGEALDVIMEGEQITADDAQKVIDTLGADKLTKMGYDASSAEAFAKSYNEHLQKQNIAPMSEVAKAEKEFRKNKAVEQLREESFDLVYKNPKQGLAYQYEGKTVTPMPGNMTAVEFAEHERANFKARTTAKMDGVTLELSGMEARQGLTDEQIFAEAKKTLTKKAARKLDAYMKISKALSLPMVIRDVVTGTSGYVHDGKLYVTLSGRQSILRVVAHELTHQMKDLPGYASLRNRLIAEVGGQAEFDKLIEEKARKYGLDLDTEKGREEADDEVCAELCERMLANEEALEKFAEKDTEAAKTLRDRLLKILNAIKDALKSVGNRDFGDSKSDLIKEQETIEEWYKNLSEAIKNVENKVASDELLLSEEDKANAARKQETEALANREAWKNQDIRYSVDTDAIRQAFTVIDTEGIEDGLEALKDVKHVGMFALKDISRMLDASAGKNKDLRNTLHAIFEKPHSEATGRYARGVERMQNRVMDIAKRAGVVDEKGKRFDSKKSAAIQNIGEGFSNTYTDLKLKVKDADHVTVKAYEQGTENLVVSEKDYTLKELRKAYGTNAADYVWSQVFDKTQKAQETGKQAEWVEETVNTRPYTLADLQAAFPNDWQQLKHAADEFRDMYDEYIRDQNNMLATIYPIESEFDSEDRVQKAIDKKQERLEQHKTAVNVQLDNLQKRLEAKEQEMAGKKRTDTKAFRDLVEQANRIGAQIASVKSEIAEYEANVKEELAKLAALKAEYQNARQRGELDSLSRMHRLQYRSDYFHHFTEMASGIQNLRAIFTNNTDQDISPHIVGRSENTKAKARWAGYFQERMGGDYTADAINGMLEYGQLAEYKLAFDPLTAYLRDVNKQIRNLDDNTNRDGLIRYIDQWADAIAGKSHKLDRNISDLGMAPRKAMQILNWINSRVIQNTLLFNARSSLLQISNITNAMGIVKNINDWMNGLRSWALAAKGDQAMADIMAQSNFLASRYMDNLQLTDSKLKSVKAFGGWLLGALDEISAKATWWAAYHQYIRNPKAAKNQYRAYDNAIDYADDVTRRTHAGRGVGELAPAMTSRVINFVAPFQVEVNNTFQLLKDNIKQGNYLGILSTGLSVFLFNALFEGIVGSSPLQFDFIRAVLDIVLGFAQDDPKDDKDDYGILQAWQRLSGEAFGSLPYAGQLASIIGKDTAKKLFGEDNDATRYGNTQIGINAVINAVKGVKDIGTGLVEGRKVNWVDDLDDLLNLTLPFGAKQLTRTIEGVRTVAKGYEGKYDKEGKEEVHFTTDGDILEAIHAALFGKWSLTEASEYFGEKRLLPQLFGEYNGPKSSIGNAVDAKEYKAALQTGIDGKEYFTLKSDLSKYSTQPGKRAEMMQQKLTPEQKAKLDALMFGSKDTEMKADGAVVYQMSSDGEWKVKADYTNQDLFDLSQAGDKAYTGTLEAMDKTGLPQDQAALAASMWDRAKEADDRKAEFRSMLRDNANLTVEQKEALDLQYCGNKYPADYSDPELYDLSVTNRATYEKAKQAKAKGVPVSTFTGLSEKKAAHEGDGQAAYMRGEIMKTNLTAKQKELLDDLLVSDKGSNPDYSSQAWFDVSMLGKTQYDKAKAGAKVGVKPEVYLAAYKKYKEVNRKDKDGKYVNTKKEAKALLKAYMDKQPISAPVYDYIWTAVFGYKSR